MSTTSSAQKLQSYKTNPPASTLRWVHGGSGHWTLDDDGNEEPAVLELQKKAVFAADSAFYTSLYGKNNTTISSERINQIFFNSLGNSCHELAESKEEYAAVGAARSAWQTARFPDLSSDEDDTDDYHP